MKTMLQKLQTLGQKAAQLQQAVNAAPAKVAQIRETLHLTAGQLQLARTELQQVATGLHVENDEDFTNAFREITDNAHVFEEAGYDLTGIDLEVSQPQRLIVHFERHTSVPEPSLRYILTQNNSKITVASILNSIIKAEALSDKIHAPNIEYVGLMVHLGTAPAVRLSWREMLPPEVSAPTATVAASMTQSTPLPAVSTSVTTHFAPGSFFEKTAPRPTVPAEEPVQGSPEPMEIPSPTQSRPGFSGSKSLQGDWKKEALERLKSSPGVSKYRR